MGQRDPEWRNPMRLFAVMLVLLPSMGLAPGLACAQGALPPRMMKVIKADPQAWLQDVAR
jgi:hypothetical protein